MQHSSINVFFLSSCGCKSMLWRSRSNQSTSLSSMDSSPAPRIPLSPLSVLLSVSPLKLTSQISLCPQAHIVLISKEHSKQSPTDNVLCYLHLWHSVLLATWSSIVRFGQVSFCQYIIRSVVDFLRELEHHDYLWTHEPCVCSYKYIFNLKLQYAVITKLNPLWLLTFYHFSKCCKNTKCLFLALRNAEMDIDLVLIHAIKDI